eukprot:1187688-Prorocentrum_minimum.AAC.2
MFVSSATLTCLRGHKEGLGSSVSDIRRPHTFEEPWCCHSAAALGTNPSSGDRKAFRCCTGRNKRRLSIRTLCHRHHCPVRHHARIYLCPTEGRRQNSHHEQNGSLIDGSLNVHDLTVATAVPVGLEFALTELAMLQSCGTKGAVVFSAH